MQVDNSVLGYLWPMDSPVNDQIAFDAPALVAQAFVPVVLAAKVRNAPSQIRVL
jgi:hypothetical protein